MTQVFWVFPEVHVKPAPKKERKGPAHKYDHWQMLQDRISGMTWTAIGRKHEVSAPEGRDVGRVARLVAMNSNATKRLSPREVQKLFALSSTSFS